jgi:hypothetical protein
MSLFLFFLCLYDVPVCSLLVEKRSQAVEENWIGAVTRLKSNSEKAVVEEDS